LILRLSFGDANYYWEDQYLYSSPNAFINRSDGVWTYAPDTQIRQIGVYGFAGYRFIPAAAFRIEYDCLYETNNLGLVQRRDFSPGEHVTLVLGDSFTVGQGGCPWFYNLEEKLKEKKVVNGGLQATGLISWANLANYLLSKGLIIDNILIVAISNDFKRDAFNWPKQFFDCINVWNCPTEGLWAPVGLTESSESILNRSIARAAVRNATKTTRRKVHELLLRTSFAYTYISRAYSAIRIPASPDPRFPSGDADAIASLQRIDPKLKFVLVRQRDEAATKRMNADSIAAERFLQKRSIPFDWCKLEDRHYLPLDAHPNALGYEVLSNCVLRALPLNDE
jgi:hypothetical protein